MSGARKWKTTGTLMNMVMVMVMVMVMMTRGLAVNMRDQVMLVDKALDPADVDSTFPVNKKCECKMRCFVDTDCHMATSQGSVCHTSTNTDAYSRLLDAPGNFTFYWQEYTLHGTRWYKLYEGSEAANYFDASDRCQGEGGQLALAHTADQLEEVTDFLTDSGLSRVWVALFYTKEECKDGVGPFWIYKNGIKVQGPQVLPLYCPNRCYHIKKTGGGQWVFKNTDGCMNTMDFLCQRPH